MTLPAGNLLRMSTATKTLQRWICESCGYIYDPEEGDPDGGIPAGTAFEDIPDTWFCPVCGARKRDFVLYED
jgi:rubredoxin